MTRIVILYQIFKTMIARVKPEFVPKIELGIKIHTIRHDRANRWRAGLKIQLGVGGYGPGLLKIFKVGAVVNVQKIEIRQADGSTQKEVLIDGRALLTPEIDRLAINDGFNSTADFFKFFNNDFVGKLIHWTPARY